MRKKKKKKKLILFGEKSILFGLFWSLPQEHVKGNSEDLKGKKKKKTENGLKFG